MLDIQEVPIFTKTTEGGSLSLHGKSPRSSNSREPEVGMESPGPDWRKDSNSSQAGTHTKINPMLAGQMSKIPEKETPP